VRKFRTIEVSRLVRIVVSLQSHFLWISRYHFRRAGSRCSGSSTSDSALRSCQGNYVPASVFHLHAIWPSSFGSRELSWSRLSINCLPKDTSKDAAGAEPTSARSARKVAEIGRQPLEYISRDLAALQHWQECAPIFRVALPKDCGMTFHTGAVR